MSLGCPDGYTVELRVRGGAVKVGTFTGVTQVTWQRLLTGTSEGTVTVRPRSRDCARLIDAAIEWGHELCIWRDGERVWEGPLVDTDDSGTAEVVLTAADVTGWLPRRVMHYGYDTGAIAAGMDVCVLGAMVLGDAFGPDDPDVLRHVETRPSGVMVIDRAVEPESGYADAELEELTKLGLDWTVIGRRVVLFGRGDLLGRLPRLSGRHFAGGGLPVRRAGRNAVTRCIVQGGGARGEAGGVDPVLGLLEKLDTQAAVVEDSDAVLAARAGLYTPTLLVASGDVALNPRAPVSIDQLVPGVAATVLGRGAAVQVAADMLLSKVAVSWDTKGEAVSVTFTDTETGAA